MAAARPAPLLPVSTVVIDTNVLWAGHALNAQAIRELVALKEKARIVVPDAVALELTRHLTEEDGRAQAQLKNALRSRETAGIDVAGWRSLTDLYWDGKVRQLILTFAATILPHPDVSHEDLVLRDLMKSPPFKTSGAGYRDALIWATVCEQASDRGLTVLVTNNSKDFGQGAPARTLMWDVPDGARLYVVSTVNELKDLIAGAPVKTEYYRNTRPPIPWSALQSSVEDAMPLYSDVDNVRIGRQVRVAAVMEDVAGWGEVWEVNEYEADDGLGYFSIVVVAEVYMTADLPREQLGHLDTDIGVSLEDTESEAHLNFQREVHVALDVSYRLDNRDVAGVTLIGVRYHED